MSYSTTISSTKAFAPRAVRPALAQLMAIHPHQSRSIWHCARSQRDSRDKLERISRRIDKYQRHPPATLRRRTESRYEWPCISHQRHPGWGSGWGWWWSRSSFSDLSSDRRHKRFWDAETEQLQLRMQQLRKRIEADPYAAIFGRRLEPFFPLHRFESSWSGFLRSFMNVDKPTGPKSMGSAQWQTGGGESPFKEPSDDALQYDPISGRMAPRPPKPAQQPDVPSNIEAGASEKIVDCPPGNELEAKFVSNPSLVEDGQFQPGNNQSHEPVLKSSTQAGVIDCPPGNELEASLISNSASFMKPQTEAVPFDAATKPNINIACSPGSELEAKFISESVRSEDEQPQLGMFNVQETAKELDADAGLSSRGHVECPPGTELEAMFISDPASRHDSTLPPQVQTGSSSNMTVDCPPGNELDAKFISESSSDSAMAETTQHTEVDISSEIGTGSHASVDCSSGAEVEARLLTESANVKPEGLGSVDCPPGNELEAQFISDPASAENGQFQAGLLAGHGSGKTTNVTVDCAPGNELEALLVSESACSQPASENLDTMSASDIHSRYATEPVEAQTQRTRTNKDLEFDGSEDRIGDVLRQSANLATNSASSSSVWSSAAYRILAYDSTASQVTTAEADSFFGAEETKHPAEILSRLHNPAKFVPYFAPMQQDGYEIATGGGDILVFRKAHGTSSHKASSSAPTMQNDSDNAEVRAQIAKSIRHESIPAAAEQKTPSGMLNPSPDRVVSRQETLFTGGQLNWSPYPASSSASNHSSPGPGALPSRHKSSFRQTFRRMVFACTATAGTCYAIGTVTEYFRTGGKDGRGIDGFTVFESERRQRE